MIADLRVPLRQVAETGIAVVPGAAAVPAGLMDELAALPYKEPPQDAHPVTTLSELAVLSTWDGYPLLAGLRAELVAAVNRSVADWQPDQIFVRRYRRGSEGMSPHRDGVRFRLLIATMSVAGSAYFFRHDEKGEVIHAWPIDPGDLVLLRGTALRGVEDGRPYHSVCGPAGDLRCSVAFRMT